MPNVQREDFVPEPGHQPVKPAFNQLRTVRDFMRCADLTVDQFNVKQTGLYVGLQLEEMCKQLQEIADGHVTPIDPHSELFQAMQWMTLLARQLKEDQHHGAILRADRGKFLDAVIGSIFLSCGTSLSYANDSDGAFREVARCNMDKVTGGITIRDGFGKIQKPIGWQRPDVTPFVRARELDE